MSQGEKVDPVDVDPVVMNALKGLPEDFSHFGTTYMRDIRPKLLEREHDRIRAADRARQFRWYAIGGGAAGAIAGFAVGVPGLAFVAAMGAFALWIYGEHPLRKIGKEAKTLLVEPIARQFDLSYVHECGPQSLVNEMKEKRLLPNWDRSNFEDRIDGRRGETDFEFFEAHLQQRRTERSSNGGTRTKWVTVFRGQCLRFDFHKTFYGRTRVMRDAGLFNAFGDMFSDMDRARLEDPEFEKTFEVYTNDQVEARFLLTPDVMQRLLDLEEAFHGAKLRCAFEDGQLFMALEGGDMFEPGSMFTPLDNPERVRELLDDFSALFRLIDDLGPRAGQAARLHGG